MKGLCGAPLRTFRSLGGSNSFILHFLYSFYQHNKQMKKWSSAVFQTILSEHVCLCLSCADKFDFSLQNETRKRKFWLLTYLIFSFHEVCAHGSMCCIFQHADTDSNNLVNVCLCQENPLVCCIRILDSGGQVEIQVPSASLANIRWLTVWCILKSLWLFLLQKLRATGFNFWPG